MPCLTHTCKCGERLLVYMPPSKQFESFPLATTRDLEERDRLEDADREIQGAVQASDMPALTLDARESSLCPACARQLRFMDGPGLMLNNPTRGFPCSHLFWGAALHLAEEHGWRAEGLTGPFGIREAIARAVGRGLPEIPADEMQTDDFLQDQNPRHMLSGRFRNQVVDLTVFLKEGRITIDPDVEAVTVVSGDDVEAFRLALMESGISRN